MTQNLLKNEFEFISLKFTDIYNNFNQIDIPYYKNLPKIIRVGNFELKQSKMNFHDQFRSFSTLSVICNQTNEDPRSLLEEELKKTNVDTKAVITMDFCIFEDVKFKIHEHHLLSFFDSDEAQYNSDKDYTKGNSGARPIDFNANLCSDPIDNLSNIRAEIVLNLIQVGINCTYHCHSKNAGQCTISFEAKDIMNAADYFVIVKYIIRNVVLSFGKSVTFMPNPMYSVRNNLKIEFFGPDTEKLLFGLEGYAGELQSLFNPITNSYKRLTKLDTDPWIYSSDKLEINFIDSAMHPYLAFWGLLMASSNKKKNKTTMTTSLENAVFALKAEKIFDNSIVSKYVDYNLSQHYKINACPTPFEVSLYYNI